MVVVCVVCVVCVVVVFGGVSVEAVEEGAEGLVEAAASGGGAGTEWAIGVFEHAGMGTRVADEKPTPDFADTHFCALTPLPPTPPESAGTTSHQQ